MPSDLLLTRHGKHNAHFLSEGEDRTFGTCSRRTPRVRDSKRKHCGGAPNRSRKGKHWSSRKDKQQRVAALTRLTTRQSAVKSELAAAMAQHQVRSFTIRAWLTTALVHTYATSLKVHRSSGCPRLANTHHHHHRTVVSCTERRSDCPRSTTPLI